MTTKVQASTQGLKSLFPAPMGEVVLTTSVVVLAAFAGVLRFSAFNWLGILSVYCWYVALAFTSQRRKGRCSIAAIFWECAAVVGGVLGLGLIVLFWHIAD